MRFPRAARPAAKLLILLALGAISQSSPSEAARRCPLGQILRVSLGTCVPKAQNLAIMAKHGARKSQPADAEEDAPPAPTRKPAREEAASPARASPAHASEAPVEIARDEAPSPAEQKAPQPSPQPETSRVSPFGVLFVGAFHSMVTTGRSAFR